MPDSYRGWEYARLGDYHRNLDPNWSYTHTYLRKMQFVRSLIEATGPDAAVLDVGCGEGLLVEHFRDRGWDIRGLDLNYESQAVDRGNALAMPYSDGSFDLVLLLDTLEHLAFVDQPNCLAELRRVLRDQGRLVLSVPNLAHLNSRFRFFFRGGLDRTDIETNHIGERPNREYKELLNREGFIIEKELGVTFTSPWLYRGIFCKDPARFEWLQSLLEPLARIRPSLALLSIIVCRPLTNGHATQG